MTINLYVGQTIARQRLEEIALNADRAYAQQQRQRHRVRARRRFPRVHWPRPRLATSA